MDLSSATIRDVIHPTAIFYQPFHPSPNNNLHEPLAPQWNDSQLNPKNRIDSLTPPKQSLWDIDGCAALGTQFYVVPLFLEYVPPTRCDVLISEDATDSPLIRRLLDLDTVFHSRDRVRLERQGIYAYIIRALNVWTARVGLHKIRDIYFNQPFGTRIIFENLPMDVHAVSIHIAYTHFVESRQRSMQQLAAVWKTRSIHWNPGPVELPQTVDIYSLEFVSQLHDSVCLVRYHQREKDHQDIAEGINELWVFKALTSSVKFMYHELKVLLHMPPHPNIVARPAKLVVKKSRMNDKRVIVVGFLTEYYTGGGLRDQLPLLRKTGRLKLEDQLHWAEGICAGMIHITHTAKTYYPDLRLDQIVFPADKQRPVILDMEQRGVWAEFGPPEINAVEYIKVLALEQEETDSLGPDKDADWPLCDDYASYLDQLLDNWRDLDRNDGCYNNPECGYNVAWAAIRPEKREYAEVYMLGRLLWCIFEGMSAPQLGAIWQSYHDEPEHEFPEYRLTPEPMRHLIDRCTKGRREPLSRLVIRRGNKVILRHEPGGGNDEQVREVARKFWEGEVKWAQCVVRQMINERSDGKVEDNPFDRPKLSAVAAMLQAFRASYCS